MNHIEITPFDKDGKQLQKMVLNIDIIDLVGKHEGKTVLSSLTHGKSWMCKESPATILKRMRDTSPFLVTVNTMTKFMDVYEGKLANMRKEVREMFMSLKEDEEIDMGYADRAKKVIEQSMLS